MQKLLAAVCRCCPFCIAKRKWPNSAFARFMRMGESGCPFCRAYNRLKQEEK